MKLIPIYDATAPIACTAGDELPIRIAQIERLRSHLTRVERTEHGLLLSFPARPEIEDEVSRFAVEEKGCCGFWGFAVDADGDELTLRWDGPPDTNEIIDRLHEFFEGDEPLTLDSGLL